jgi:hypothetical protein
MRRANIRRFVTEHALREDGKDTAILQYSLEWDFFIRCQWGEFDTALYKLENVRVRMPLSDQPKQAIYDHLKTGQRKQSPGH